MLLLASNSSCHQLESGWLALGLQFTASRSASLVYSNTATACHLTTLYTDGMSLASCSELCSIGAADLQVQPMLCSAQTEI